jgi:bacteriocin-like protein
MDINSIKAAAKARYGMEITDDQARHWLGSHPSGELTDDELDNVTGGCGGGEKESRADSMEKR